MTAPSRRTAATLLSLDRGVTPDLPLSRYRRALVAVPHPDDEAIGCGGLIACLAAQGCDVQLLLATDGSGGPDAPFNAVEIRVAEYARSAAILGARERARLMLPDSALRRNFVQLKRQTASHVRDFAPDLLIAPAIDDPHPDHAALASCMAALAFDLALPLITYEVWAPIQATHVLDIAPYLESKRQAIQVHQTALRFGNYLRAALGLAEYRSLLLPFRPGVDLYAEAYKIFL
ncbi:PIG-L deacetylase family protein [Thiomonas sp.]